MFMSYAKLTGYCFWAARLGLVGAVILLTVTAARAVQALPVINTNNIAHRSYIQVGPDAFDAATGSIAHYEALLTLAIRDHRLDMRAI